MVVFVEKGSIRVKSCCIRVKWLYSNKIVLLGQSGSIKARVSVFCQKWLYSGTNSSIRVKKVVFGQRC